MGQALQLPGHTSRHLAHPLTLGLLILHLKWGRPSRLTSQMGDSEQESQAGLCQWGQ